MTQEDSLYPSRSVLPFITKAITEGAPIYTISYPFANHQPLYFDDQTETVIQFMKKMKRNAYRQRLRWLMTDNVVGKVGWAEVLEFGASANESEPLAEINVMTTPGRVSLGVELETDNKVKRVADDSLAAEIGIKPGDKIVEFDGVALNGSRQLGMAIRKKTYGDDFTCAVARGDEQVDFSSKFPEFTSRPVFSRKLPTSFFDCELDEEGPMIRLQSRNVKRLRISLPDSISAKTIELKRGDSKSQVKVQQFTAKELLSRFAESPNSKLRTAYVDIE